MHIIKDLLGIGCDVVTTGNYRGSSSDVDAANDVTRVVTRKKSLRIAENGVTTAFLAIQNQFLRLVDQQDAVLDDFKGVYERFKDEYMVTDRYEAIRLLNSLYGQNIEISKLRQKMLNHDKKAFESL